MVRIQKLIFIITSVVVLAVQCNAVSVNPSLCPTNKIAPHRNDVSKAAGEPRTLGLLYGFLAPSPGRPIDAPPDYLDELQEKPQEDDPDDCGEIEDYDETDLSSITPGANNKVADHRKDRYLFADSYIVPPYYPTYSKPPRPARPSQTSRPPRPPPTRPPYRPTTRRPPRPTYLPTRPPFHSGGIFGSNVYRPSTHYYPSSHIKPVQEDTYDHPQAAYRPALVGGTLAHVIGFPLVRPNLLDDLVTSAKRPNSPFRFPESDSYNTRRPRAKPPNFATNVIGSFVDLLFN